jgi:Amino-transferase class IV
VTIAAVGHHQNNSKSSENDIEVDESLPTRYLNPQNKVQSWTRIRKKMEIPIYKPPGVSEVLMVRPCNNTSSDLEVLEGLSSNFFVIYKDGTIRTAQDGVLFGYVRHLVLESLEACGLVLDPKPVLLHEAKNLWKEAFITSSSRLVFPVSQILVHSDNTADFEEYWSDPFFKEGAAITEKPKWQELLEEIMRRGGYPACRDFL